MRVERLPAQGGLSECVMIASWVDMANRLRISPAAVARQLITQLDTHKALSPSDERKIIAAIDNAGVQDGVNRMLANLSRQTLNRLIKEI